MVAVFGMTGDDFPIVPPCCGFVDSEAKKKGRRM
jgi:hypothetical protein